MSLSYLKASWKGVLEILLQVITGYLLAGSVIGPGGFSFVSEMVQVRCFCFCWNCSDMSSVVVF